MGVIVLLNCTLKIKEIFWNINQARKMDADEQKKKRNNNELWLMTYKTRVLHWAHAYEN